MSKKHFLYLIAISLSLKVIYFLMALVLDISDSSLSLQDNIIEILKKNDSYWYEKIFFNGYPNTQTKEEIGYAHGKYFHQSNWAFFPFYPYLLKGLSTISGFDFNTSALIISFLFSIAANIGCYWLANIFFKNTQKSFFATVLLFLFPFAYYFSVFYTEALFFTSLVFCFISIYYKKHFTLSLLLIPLVLLRPNGLFMLIPLYIYFLETNGLIHKTSIKWSEILSRKLVLNSMFFVSGVLAFIGYCYFQYLKTGYFFAFSIAQEGWYRHFSFPLVSFFNRGDMATQFNSVYTIITILFSIYAFKRIPLSYNILIWISLLLPLTSGAVTSMPRFISLLFPLFFVLSDVIYNLKTKYLILLCLLIIQLGSFYFWLIDSPLSF